MLLVETVGIEMAETDKVWVEPEPQAFVGVTCINPEVVPAIKLMLLVVDVPIQPESELHT